MTSTVELKARSANSNVVDGLLAVARTLVATVASSLSDVDEDVTVGQYRALVILCEGPQRTSDLAQKLEVASSTVTRTCDRLARKQLVRRYRRSDDRRATWVMLTSAGQQLVGDVMRRRRAVIVRLVRNVPAEHRDALAAGLRSVVDAAGETSESEWWKRWRVATHPDPLAVDG